MCNGGRNVQELLRIAQKGVAMLQRAQTKLHALEVHGEAGAGLVKVTMLGTGRVKKLEIAPTIRGGENGIMEDLVLAAVNKAYEKLEDETKSMFHDTMPPGVDPNVFFRAMR